MKKDVKKYTESAESVLNPFKKNIGWKKLVKKWFLFIFVGFIVMGGIQSFARYDFEEADTLTSETGVGCDTVAMILLILLPPIEELLFRIGPHKYFGKRGALVGTVLWALLHVVGRNYAIVGFQLVVGMFYYKLVISEKYKEVIIFHEAFNLIPLLTCFFF